MPPAQPPAAPGRTGLLILSAPSGAGKTSLARYLAAKRRDAGIAVSHTTRERRAGERAGVDYCFVSPERFNAMIAQQAFIEHAKVFGHYYGTSAGAVERLLGHGKHAILDIDWQGARNVRRQFPQAVSVFVMPPSIAELERRLRRRRRDGAATISRRMREAENQIDHKDEFDVIIVNDDFQRALDQLEAVLDRLSPVGGREDSAEHNLQPRA